MTNTPPNRPSESSDTGIPTRFWRWLKKPSTLVGGGILLTLGVAGYAGIQYFVYQRLSPLLSTILSDVLQREVEVGEVKDFYWTGIRIGESGLPRSDTDPDNATVQEIIVNYNILPVLIGQPLKANVTVVDPNLYVEQDKTGKWVEIPEFPEGDGLNLPIDLDIDVDLQDADVVLVPNALPNPVTIEAEGKAGYAYQDKENQQISYDLDATILNSVANLAGETEIGGGENFGKTQAQVLLKELNIGDVVALIPQSPATVDKGELSVDLGIDLPSLQGIEGTQGEGEISLPELVAKIKPIKEPIKAEVAINLDGQKVLVDRLKVSLGKLVTEVKGDIDWQQGYNLSVLVNPFRIPEVLRTVNLNLPIKLEGEVGSKVQVRGKILNPIVSGVVQNTKPIIIEKTGIKSVEAKFQATLDQILLSQVSVTPADGGKILAKGRVRTNIKKALEDGKAIDWQKFPIALDFSADLPTQALIDPYVNTTSQAITISPLKAAGQVRGIASKPQGKINWNLPTPSNVAGVGISGNGEVLLSGQNFAFNNVLSQSNGGSVNIDGGGSLKDLQIQAKVKADSFALSPFIPVVCREFVQCPDAVYSQAVSISSADVNAVVKLDELTLNNIDANANASLLVNGSNIAVNGNLSDGNLNGAFQTANLNVDPYISLVCQEIGQCPDELLSQSIQVVNANGNISGNLETIDINKIDGGLNALLTVNGGNVAVNGNLTQGNIQSTVFTSNINLTPYVPIVAPTIDVPVNLNEATVNLSASLPQLLQQLQQSTVSLESVNLDLIARLSVDNSPVNAAANVQRGILEAVANTGSLSVNRFIPNLPLSADLVGSQVNITGNLNSLLQTINTNPDLSSFNGRLAAQLTAAEGTVNVLSRFNMNQFGANVVAAGIIPRELCTSFALDCSQIPSLDEAINAKADIKGNFGAILAENSILPVQVSSFAANWGEQAASGNGSLLITDLTKKPDIATANFNLNASANLNKIPLEEFLTLIPVKRTLLPEELNLTGIGGFSGQFKGKNLLSDPLRAGNTLLSGNLTLDGLSFNDRNFEPTLKGTVNAGLGQSVNLNLQGKEDQIAAKLDPCTRQGCLAPYLPTSFALKQTYNTALPDEAEEQNDKPFPLIVRGERKGDRLLASVETFPLSLLKIAPLQEYGINGYVKGKTKLTADVNLFTLTGSGTVTIDQLGVGLIEADQFTADVAYQDQIAKLKAGTLTLGNSNYDVQGQLNIETLEVAGLLNVEEAYIEDILTTLKITDVQSLLALIQRKSIDYATAILLQETIPVADDPKQRNCFQDTHTGYPQATEGNATIAQQVNCLAEIDRQIIEFAQRLQQGKIPSELNITGAFTTQASVSGTLLDPSLQVKFDAKRWRWRPQAPIPNIVSPLGLITEGDQAIPLQQIGLEATLEDGVVNIASAGLKIREMEAQAQGTASLENLDLTYGVSNLSLDTIQAFVSIPLDVAGNINLSGELKGNPFNPNAKGIFSFEEGAINAQDLETDIKGEFAYEEARLTAQTLEPDFIVVKASVPYPPTPETNDQIDVNVNIGTKALQWVSLLTGEQVVWSDGDGNVELTVNGTLDMSDGFDVNLVANGKVNLENGTITSPLVPNPLIVNGVIEIQQGTVKVGNNELILSNGIISIDQLIGQYGESEVLIAGVLPIFEPKAVSNPLTVALNTQPFTLEGLYQGEVGGEIILTGYAFEPTIGGNVNLSSGRILVPQAIMSSVTSTISNDNGNSTKAMSVQADEQMAYNQWLQPSDEPISLPIVPTFNDFTVNLIDLSVKQSPLYDFAFGGNIILNGTLDKLDLNLIKPSGQIALSSGEINLAQIRLLTDRRRKSTITFEPDQSIFNPTLNIAMRTIVSEIPNSRRRIDEWSNEIPDSSLNQVQRVDINLVIDGQLRQLLPSLGRRRNNLCDLRPEDFRLIQEEPFTEAELERLNLCIQDLAMLDADQSDFFQNPAIKLTSLPPRPEGQIVRLLGEQFLAIADSLQTGSTEQLLQSGIVQIALPMIFQGVIYDIESAIGNTISARDFRIVPFLEAIYSLNDASLGSQDLNAPDPTFLRFSYDYNQNEFRVRYERQF
ncbi:MAG: translocation/assembly module TamB domain-containing protein [Microcystaceae cyanobacterium]